MAHHAQAVTSVAAPRHRGLFFWLKIIAAAAVLALAGFLLHRTLSRYSPEEIRASLAAIPVARLGMATVFAAASYVLLTGFDTLALHYVERPLAYRRVALASFAALSIGHNLGFAALSSGAVRYRFYSRWGLDATRIAQVIVFCGLTVGLGLMTLGGAALVIRPDLAVEVTGLESSTVIAVGWCCLGLLLGYLGLAAGLRRTLRIGKVSLRMPNLRLALAQIAVGAANFACVAACLHQALSAIQELPYLSVAGVYVTANVAGLISHVPGGLGVIESVVALLLPQTDVIGALVAFRVVYFLLPLCLGGVLFALSEMLIRKRERFSGQSPRGDRAAR